jgi:hypothetical protein
MRRVYAEPRGAVVSWSQPESSGAASAGAASTGAASAEASIRFFLPIHQETISPLRLSHHAQLLHRGRKEQHHLCRCPPWTLLQRPLQDRTGTLSWSTTELSWTSDNSKRNQKFRRKLLLISSVSRFPPLGNDSGKDSLIFNFGELGHIVSLLQLVV